MIVKALKLPVHTVRFLLRMAFHVLIGGFITIFIGGVIFLNNKPDLSVWHTEYLDEEFTVSSKITSFKDYLNLEDVLFQELVKEVYDNVPDAQKNGLNRFNKGSRTDPTARKPNWNRTFEKPVQNAELGVLLLHGLSDSPYSVRSLATQLHTDGAHVLGLRIPGHGTAPSGLRRTTFEDMAAAVELAMTHMKSKLGDKPIYLVGYSNGGALAVHYTSKSIENTSLPKPAGLILLSPEIGIAPAAAFAKVQAWVGETLRLKKLSRNSVEMEFDPYKYNSFALNAGVLAYHATVLIQDQLDALVKSGRIAEMPPVLAFQSAADATVKAPVLVSALFDKLHKGGHELVIFDVNRVYYEQGLLAEPLDIGSLLKGHPLSYDVSIVTNRSPKTFDAVLRERAAGGGQLETKDLGLKWPKDVYSLAHIALPFPPDDPLYGAGGTGLDNDQKIRLGSLAVHGENRTLLIPISALTRQHWNPFFSVISDKARRFVGTVSDQSGQAGN